FRSIHKCSSIIFGM
ncbi:hypothetical protein CP8484711_1669B, partial [Chlamydia psittaci 84-8471/1]